METIVGTILIVDDEPDICDMLNDCMSGRGFNCHTTQDPVYASELLRLHYYDVVISDISMPGLSGLELLAAAKAFSPASRVILITGFSARENLAQAIALGAFDYIQKPVDIAELTEAVFKAASGVGAALNLPTRAATAMLSNAKAEQVISETTRALIHAVEAKDPYTRRHSEQVTHYAVHFAQAAKLPPDEVNSIRLAALLHDIGKIGVPDHILTKPTSLTEDEFEHIRRHPALGADIIINITSLGKEAAMARHHHERWDGAGYPDGLAGSDIPLGARIIHVADSMDAMLMQRSYKKGYPVQKMLGEMLRCSGTQFDPDMVSLAANWCQQNPSKLILATKEAMAG